MDPGGRGSGPGWAGFWTWGQQGSAFKYQLHVIVNAVTAIGFKLRAGDANKKCIFIYLEAYTVPVLCVF